MSEVVVTYDSNNSGGGWWLNSEQWDKLAEAGWNVHWCHDGGRPSKAYENPMAVCEDTGETWLGARACSAAKRFENPADAIREFEEVTGEDPSAEGCNCCGPPHSFEYTDADGEHHYATARVVETEISF